MIKVFDEAERESTHSAIVPGAYVRVEGVARVSIPGSQTDAQPRVELIRDGGVVRAIDITCTCGRRIRLRCDYDQEPRTK